jgi:adenylyltransferase/sulfurtransferase
MLTDAQIERYSRQIILPEVGSRGQERLLAASVAVAGNGTAARTAALYLAAAGIGRLGVEPPLLAERRLADANADCRISPLVSPLTPEAASAAAKTHQVVVTADVPPGADGLLYAACRRGRTPLAWGRCAGTTGCATTFAGLDDQAPCYECLVTHAARLAPSGEAGALSEVTAAFIGSLLAIDAIKLVVERSPQSSGLLVFEALSGTIRQTRIVRDPSCPVCSAGETAARG